MKRPAFQYYPADWRKDAGIQSCSIAARGLWHEMNCIAHECEPYGELRINGRPMTPEQIARLVGIPLRQCVSLLKELDDNNVYSLTEDGAIYSRRMVRDEAVRNARAAGGKAGAEHGHKGATHGHKGGRPPKGEGALKTPLTEPKEPPPSSSSSSSATAKERGADAPPRKRASQLSPDWQLTEDWIEAARRWRQEAGQTPEIDYRAEGVKFKTKAREKQRVAKDWKAAWCNWCLQDWIKPLAEQPSSFSAPAEREYLGSTSIPLAQARMHAQMLAEGKRLPPSVSEAEVRELVAHGLVGAELAKERGFAA